MNSQTCDRLFSGEAQRVLRFVDHVADFADALGALRAALGVVENGLGGRSPTADRVMDFAFADGVAVTDVHLGPRSEIENASHI